MDHHDPIEAAVFERLRTNVRSLRLAAGLTVKKAAERAQMHWRHWQKIEAGQINITMLTLSRLAQVLKVDASALLGDPNRVLN
jgi:transcriptional regulator with XRE-family HTH domain